MSVSLNNIKLVRYALLLSVILVITACADRARVIVSERSFNHPKTRIIAVRLPKYYQVQNGDTVYSIAWKTGLDYSLLAKWNGLHQPWKIYQGQRLHLRPTTRKVSRHVTRNSRLRSKSKKITKNHTTARRTVAQKNQAVRSWLWPAKGKIIGRFNPGKGHKGINIKGRVGSAIRAAAAGRVVYAGNGLRGYGNLVIIKHNTRYLSAYAHNQVLLVKEGQRVRRGQRIARMGSSGSNRTQLHFEVRRRGKPVDPLRLLPIRR